MDLIAKHVASGAEKVFQNHSDMREYLRGISDAWVWFYRYRNGFETLPNAIA